MKLKKYLRDTVQKGSFIVKFLKLFRLFQHSIYYLANIKIGDYPAPPLKIDQVGFFDKKRLIHTSDRYKKYFNNVSLYQDGDFVKMKEGLICIMKFGDNILLKKTFKGYQKYAKFYNELICLDKLKSVNEVPKIVFVNYKDCSIYMEYIDGITLLKTRRLDLGAWNYNLNEIESGFMSVLNKVHENGVVIYDLEPDNMMIYNSSYYLFDFADSLYHGKLLSRFTVSLKEKEIKKLKSELLNYME